MRPGRSAGTGSRRRPLATRRLAACEHPRRPPRPHLTRECLPGRKSPTTQLQRPSHRGRTRTTGPCEEPSAAQTLAAPPLPIDVELATLVDAPPQGEGWLAEAKYDGYRLVLVLDGGRARAFTRSHADWSDRFAPLVRAVEGLPAVSAVLDGEAVVFDAEGVSRFELLQTRAGRASRAHRVRGVRPAVPQRPRPARHAARAAQGAAADPARR